MYLLTLSSLYITSFTNAENRGIPFLFVLQNIDCPYMFIGGDGLITKCCPTLMTLWAGAH